MADYGAHFHDVHAHETIKICENEVLWNREGLNNGQRSTNSANTFQTAAVLTSRKHRQLIGDAGILG